MALPFGTGKAGRGASSYSVWLPFVLSPGQALRLGNGDRFELFGHVCEISQEHDQYVLTIGGFDTEDAASTFLPKACAGLIWYGLKYSLGFRFNPNPTPVTLLAQAQPASQGPFAAVAGKKGWREYDGYYYVDQTTIRPDNKRLLEITGHDPLVRVDTPVSTLSKAMLEGMAEGRPELVLDHPKLWLACEVYLSSHFESTPAARFLSRITTLEILLPDAPVSERVHTMVRQFMGEATAALKEERDAAVRRDFATLVSGLDQLRSRSITSRIQSLVEEKLQTETDIKEPAKIAIEVSQLYHLRSRLVHNGKADSAAIRRGNSRLNKIVPQILRSLYRETAQRAPSRNSSERHNGPGRIKPDSPR